MTRTLQSVTGDEVTVTFLAFPALGAEEAEPLRFGRLVLVTYD